MSYLGGKAKGLEGLLRAGTNVPQFSEWVFPRPLVPALDSVPWKEFYSHLKKEFAFPNSSVIIRSNLAIEDGVNFSFAGIFKSIGPISSELGAHEAVTEVLSSYHSELALAYMERNQIPKAQVFPVLIQEFIEPEYAGVALSTFPEYPDEMVIHYVEGRGEYLVSGDSKGEALHYCRKRQEWIEKEIPANWPNELRLKVQELENSVRYPVDIEFGVYKNRLYFFQMRPLTQKLPERIVLDNSNIQESYAGISSPLTFSFASHAYATVYRQTMRLMRLPESKITAYEQVLTNLLYQYKGRIFYHIQHWYQGLLLLPSFRHNKSDMEAMMGLENPLELVQDDQRTLLQRLSKAPQLLGTYVRMLSQFYKLEKQTILFREAFKKEFDAFYRRPLSELRDEELAEYWERLDEKVLKNWSVPIVNDFYVMMLNGRLRRKWTKEKMPAEELINRCLALDMDLESLAPDRFYRQLADEIKDDEALITKIKSNEPILDWLKENRPELNSKIGQFIHQFGDRVVGELKLETKTLRQDPEKLFRLLANYLELTGTKLETETAYLEPYRNQTLFIKLKKAVERREALRMERTRLFGMYRCLFLELGARWQLGQHLAEAQDIFFMEMDEIRNALVYKQFKEDSSIEKRKAKWASYYALQVPGHLTLPHRLISHTQDYSEGLNGEVILGEDLEGEAVLYAMDGEIPDLKGKILCAPRTDPGWVPLFPSCKAVLIEKGSALSHSVIVLREMGIPCMINIPGLSQQIETGMHLHLDFENGQIKILDK